MNFPVYEACGNKFIIFSVKDEGELFALKNSTLHLSQLAEVGRQTSADSIMVIAGNPLDFDKQGYHVSMDVFEPHSYNINDQQSGWSTMCGNGIRGVAQYLVNSYAVDSDLVIKTGAGKQRVYWHKNFWKVDMGLFTTDAVCLKKYVTTIPHRLSELLKDKESLFLQTEIFVGFHYQPEYDVIDGEPHLIVFHFGSLNQKFLISLTEEIGRDITHNTNFFPDEINTSIVVVDCINSEKKILQVSAATYERHIHYVTQACGTAATVIGSILFQQYNLSSDWQIEVTMPGGILYIEKDDHNRFYLSGEAKQIMSVREDAMSTEDLFGIHNQ